MYIELVLPYPFSSRAESNRTKPMKVCTEKNKLHQNPDRQIWRQIKQGDSVALGQLYDRYIDILFSFGIQQSNDRAYVMDCIHDLFLDLYKYRKKIADTDNVKSYLFTSLKRKINKKYRRRPIPISVAEPNFDTNMHRRHTISHEAAIIEMEQVAERNLRLANAMTTLTKKQQKGLFLRFNQAKPYEEIADILEISIDSARTTVYRAIKALREQPFIVLILPSLLFF